MKLINPHLESADRTAHRNFRNMLSHELRTPIAVIQGYSHALKEKLDEEHHELLQPIVDGAYRLSTVVSALLELEALPVSPDAQIGEFSVDSSLLSALYPFRQAITEKGLDLHLEIVGDDWLASSYDYVLEKACMRLIDNALKFTEGGSISIKASSVGDFFEIIIRDTGIGFPEESDRLFEPFVQASQGLTRQYGGLGLGLHLAKRSAEALGGGITLENDPEGGAVVTMRAARRLTSTQSSTQRRVVRAA